MKQRKPHFLFVSGPFGGVEVWARNLQSILSKRADVDTSWIFVEWDPQEFIAKIPPFSMNWSLKAGVVTRTRLRAMVRRGARFDAALFFHLSPLFFQRRLGRRVPLAYSLDVTPEIYEAVRGFYEPNLMGTLHRWMRFIGDWNAKRLFGDMRLLLPWNLEVERSLIRTYDISPERISRLSPGIDLTNWNRPPLADGQRKTIRILFVGGDFTRKGGDVVMRMAERPEYSSCEFHFVTRDAIPSLSRNVFVHNAVAPNSDEMRRLYASADIFVLPTRADFAPTMSICEAMAMELPVITTRVGGLEHVVRDGENGFCIGVDDEQAFADRLRLLIENASLRTQFGSAGRRIVELEYDLHKNAERLLEHLQRIAGRSSSDGDTHT